MSTLTEIESAARRLSVQDRQKLLVMLAASLREEQQPLPAPRGFSDDQLRAWIDQDEQDAEQLQGRR
jgi:hypothetical protein